MGNEAITIQGTVEGTVALDAHLLVDEAGQVTADVEATSVTVRGQLHGELVVRDIITLEPGCQVTGNLRAPRIVIQEGARFRGNIDMDVELPPAGSDQGAS